MSAAFEHVLVNISQIEYGSDGGLGIDFTRSISRSAKSLNRSKFLDSLSGIR